MSGQAEFSIAYDGEALRTGSMNVRDLAPALLAVGQLFGTANNTLNEDRASIKVNVVATGHGSFEVFLELEQVGRQLINLFSSDSVVAVLNLKTLLIGGSGAVGGLIYFIK